MANICTFEMRIRGTKENCQKMMESDFPSCYEIYTISQNGTDNDYMIYAAGECRWSVSGSMIYVTDNYDSLAEKAKKFDIELEIFGYDLSEPDWVEHYHYKGDTCLKAFNLFPFFMEWELEEIDLEESDLAKYDHLESEQVYVLKDEFNEKFTYNAENDCMILDWEMEILE